jgi:hypothetical protein
MSHFSCLHVRATHYSDFTAQAYVQISHCCGTKLQYKDALSYLYGLPWVCGTASSATITTANTKIVLLFIACDVWRCNWPRLSNTLARRPLIPVADQAAVWLFSDQSSALYMHCRADRLHREGVLPWLRRFVVGLSPLRPGFDVRPVYKTFLVAKVTLRQVSHRVPRFSPVRIIPPLLHTHISFIYHRFSTLYCLAIDRIQIKPDLWGIFVATG